MTAEKRGAWRPEPALIRKTTATAGTVRAIGLMSGTSADGMDAAAVFIEGGEAPRRATKLVALRSVPFDREEDVYFVATAYYLSPAVRTYWEKQLGGPRCPRPRVRRPRR